MDKHVYIIGPNKELNEVFLGQMFGAKYKFAPDMFKLSTDKIEPTDAIHTYVILDGNEEWLIHYSTKRLEDTVLVKDF